MPRLPNELCDQILANLTELRSLRSCALVCRAWASTAQRSLFATLRIHEKNVAPICELLGSTAPHFANYVQHLYILTYGDLRTNLETRMSKDAPLPIIEHLFPYLSLFANVKELTLDSCRQFVESTWDTHWTNVIASAFPSLPKLNILYSKFEALADLVDLVAAFPVLTALRVDDIDIEEASHEYSNEEQEPYRGTKTPPEGLDNISYCSASQFGSGGGPFLRWLAAHPGNFTTLYLDLAAEAGDVNAGVDLITATGDKLHNLTLAFDDQWQLWEDFELSPNTSLQNFTIRRASDIGDSLPELIQTISSPLETLTLGNIEEIEPSMHSLIAALMAMPSLTRVTFYVGYTGNVAEWIKNLTEDHPEFMQSGIVIVDNKEQHEW
ncbi:F-box domain-containing protein [Mycena indigotica]|uniref:F-box domain-containing protein n=1 Tax=Mycena indigotica TaxID=2126181 RepID=A0A8H6SBQ2_9AGAR|nr:F-box domain-containing protein [Mycena indigotica]KAF7295392.1 F-box domain-containing protein [Mycena indigotica]